MVGSADGYKQKGLAVIHRPFTFLTPATSKHFREGFSLLLQEHAILRAIIIALGDGSLLLIKDWAKNRVEFPTSIDCFPREYVFHAYVFALFEWLQIKLEEYNKLEHQSHLTLEESLLDEQTAMKVFARFLLKHQYGRVCPDDSQKQSRSKAFKKKSAVAVDSSSDEDSDDGEDSDAGEKSVHGLPFKPLHCARGGAVANSAKKQADSQNPKETDLNGWITAYQSSMRRKYGSAKVSKSGLGCKAEIPQEAFESYLLIKKHCESISCSVADFLEKKKVIFSCSQDSEDYTISRTPFNPSSDQ
jgi:hypothetical protein